MNRKRDWGEWLEEFAEWIMYIIILMGLFFMVFTTSNSVTK